MDPSVQPRVSVANLIALDITISHNIGLSNAFASVSA